MRVVAVTPQYPPMSLVGSWLATHEFLRGLTARGHDVVVYRRLAGAFRMIHDGIEVRPGKDDATVAAAIADADVVVSHLGDDNFAHEHALEYGKPTIRLVHSPRDDAVEILKGSTLAVFNSEATRAMCGWDGPQVVIHPPCRALTATPGGRVTLVNLSQEKGGELFWRLTRRRPDMPFLGVRGGTGMQLPDLAFLGVKIPPNMDLIGPVEDMNEVYGQARIVLMPSEYEAWGMVGVEALSCGIPVIAHPTPGLRESLGAAGIFADRDSEAAWLDALDRLQDPAEWDLASERATARAAELDPETSRALFADALESLVSVAA